MNKKHVFELKKEKQCEIGRRLRKVLLAVAGGANAYVSLMDACLEDGDLRKLCTRRGIVTDQLPSSLKVEDIKKEPKTEPKEEPKERLREQQKQPTEEAGKEPHITKEPSTTERGRSQRRNQ